MVKNTLKINFPSFLYNFTKIHAKDTVAQFQEDKYFFIKLTRLKFSSLLLANSLLQVVKIIERHLKNNCFI